ncbi:MAG: DegT/DnrJ/EryC1/StrS family aminotransferase [Candidatus Paceibacterota bacterium]
MPIHFIDLKREWHFFEKNFLESFKKFGRKGIYVLGPEVEKFEKDFANYCSYKYAVGVSTGLDALEICLRSFGIKEGDEVITVSNSAVATSLAISNVGATPIFCDIGEDFLIDPKRIENLITKKTKCILPVHLFGKICDMKNINQIAKKYGLVIIEDACQAHGSLFSKESSLNTKAFSFYPTKNLGAIGEGGAIVTNEKRVSEFASSYRNYGQQGRYNHTIKGINGRIDPLQCLFMSIKLKKLNLFIKKRQKIALNYIESLRGCPNLIINNFDKTSSYHLFVIRVTGGLRTELINFLKEKKIETLIHYPTLIHNQPCYRNEYKNVSLTISEKFQDEILSLPCNPFLTPEEQAEIINKIKTFLSK